MSSINEVLNSLGDNALDLSNQPQTPKAFIVDTIKQMRVLAAAVESAEVEVEEEGEDIAALDKVMFSINSNYGNFDKDEDERINDAAREKAASASLDEILTGFQAATESLVHDEIRATIVQEGKLYQDLKYQQDKLCDIKTGIENAGGVSIQTYHNLCKLGIGIESNLPEPYLYTREPSVNGLQATVESVDKVQAAAGAAAALLGIGLIYKIFTWIRNKIKGNKGSTNAKMDKVINKAEEYLKDKTELDSKIKKAMESLQPQDKYPAIYKILNDEKAAKKISEGDFNMLLKYLDEKIIDSVDGEVIELSTSEGIEKMKQRRAQLVELTNTTQRSLKLITEELNTAIGQPKDAPAKPSSLPKSLLSRLGFKTAEPEVIEEIRKKVKPEDVVNYTKELQTLLTDTKSRELEKGIDNIVSTSKALHEKLLKNKNSLSDSQWDSFLESILKVKEVSKEIQADYTFLTHIQIKAGREVIKIIKGGKTYEGLLKGLNAQG